MHCIYLCTYKALYTIYQLGVVPLNFIASIKYVNYLACHCRHSKRNSLTNGFLTRMQVKKIQNFQFQRKEEKFEEKKNDVTLPD